jgi:hypothetical protein
MASAVVANSANPKLEVVGLFFVIAAPNAIETCARGSCKSLARKSIRTRWIVLPTAVGPRNEPGRLALNEFKERLRCRPGECRLPAISNDAKGDGPRLIGLAELQSPGTSEPYLLFKKMLRTVQPRDAP